MIYVHIKLGKSREHIGCNRKEIKVKLEESKRKCLEGHVTVNKRKWGINDDVRFKIKHWRWRVVWKQQ